MEDFIMTRNNIFKLSLTGMLIAVGVIIPMFSPVRIILEPASFTLASHVVIFMAMFISPAVAVAVAAGTTMGFFLGGFPIVVVLRAASQIIYAAVGAFYIHKIAKTPLSSGRILFFSFWVNILHALGELAVVSLFYLGGNLAAIHYDQGFLRSVLLLVGLGTVIHGMIDFEIARMVMIPLKKKGIFKI